MFFNAQIAPSYFEATFLVSKYYRILHKLSIQ